MTGFTKTYPEFVGLALMELLPGVIPV